MKFRNRNKEKEEEKKEDNDIEIIMGDDSNLEISDVGDCMKDLRPKDREQKKNIVIPKTKSK